MSNDVNLKDLSRAELDAIATEAGLTATDYGNKKELVKAITAAQNGEATEDGAEGEDAQEPAPAKAKKAVARKATGSDGHATGFDSSGTPTFN